MVIYEGECYANKLVNKYRFTTYEAIAYYRVSVKYVGYVIASPVVSLMNVTCKLCGTMLLFNWDPVLYSIYLLALLVILDVSRVQLLIQLCNSTCLFFPLCDF